MRRNDRLVDGLQIRNRRVEGAFRAVLRHWFLPGVDLDAVYRDRAVVTHRDADGLPVSSSSQPALMARMLEQLAVEPGMAVLEIGAGTGYNAALLGHLVGPQGSVTTIDVDPSVTGPAEQHLATAGAANVTVVTGDGWAPPGGRQYDRIVVTVGVWDLSPAWVDQLALDGVLVVPLWLRVGQQASIAFHAVGSTLESSSVEPCGFMRMRGPGAGAPAYHRIGGWTVCLDQSDPRIVHVLSPLLDMPSSVRSLAPLAHGWFTSVALSQPDAVHLFAEGGNDGPTMRAGILSVDPPGLAVVETHPPTADRIRSFGSEAALDRLLTLLREVPAVNLAQVRISALPTGQDADAGGALGVLTRPNFTFILRE